MAEGDTEQSLQTQLMDAWKSKKIDRFRELLYQPDVSAENWYGEPVNATLIYLACEGDAAEYVGALLKENANPNNLNPIRNKAPIHITAEHGKLEVLEVLLKDGRTDVNIQDSNGDTPLHIIAKQKLRGQSEDVVSEYIRCIELLMGHEGINVNVPNKKGYTPVHYAALNGTEQVVKTILDCAGDDLDIDTYKAGLKDKTARQSILENFPGLAELLPVKRNT